MFQFVYVIKQGFCDLLGHKMIVNKKTRKRKLNSHFPLLQLVKMGNNFMQRRLNNPRFCLVQFIYLNPTGFTVLVNM